MAKVHGHLINTRYGHGGDRCMPLYHASAGISTPLNLINGTFNAIGKKFSARTFSTKVRDLDSNIILYVGETARYLLATLPNLLDKEHKVRCMVGSGIRSNLWVQFRERFGIAEVSNSLAAPRVSLPLLITVEASTWQMRSAITEPLNDLFSETKSFPSIDYKTGTIVCDPKTGFAKRGSYEVGGEIIVRVDSETIFSGYRMAPEVMSKKFVRDLLCKGDLYYRTGEALRRTRDGGWFFLDRLGDTFRWKSENISTAQVVEVVG